MKYILEIVIDDKIKEPSCIVIEDDKNEDTLKVIVYTNQYEKLDFKNMRISSIEPVAFDYIMSNTNKKSDINSSGTLKNILSILKPTIYDNNGHGILVDFLNSFSYGKDVVSNATIVTMRAKDDEDNIDIKDLNNKILNYLNNNKKLLKKEIYISLGIYSYDLEAYEKIKMFDDTNVGFIMNDLQSTKTSKEIGIYSGVIDKVVNEVKKYDLSPLEKAMYAYDLVRINLAKSLENNSKEELEINELANSYFEPSEFYSTIYNEVLSRLGINSVNARGLFYPDEERKYTICYIDDPVYDINGVYYFDISLNSVTNIKNSLGGNLDLNHNNFILDALSTYSGFAKTKSDMELSGFLDLDFIFSDFDDSYMMMLENPEDKNFKKVISPLSLNINNVSNFIDEEILVEDLNDYFDEDKLDVIKDRVENYLRLFNNEICAEDFLQMLFNVRMIEYKNNKEIFKLSLDNLKEILYNSRFKFETSYLNEDDINEGDKVEDLLIEDFEGNFEEFSIKNDLENKIKKLKLSMFNEELNKKKKDDDK